MLALAEVRNGLPHPGLRVLLPQRVPQLSGTVTQSARPQLGDDPHVTGEPEERNRNKGRKGRLLVVDFIR